MNFRKSLLLVLIFVLTIFNSYSINLNINGEIKEYDSNYYEQISIGLNCSEEISFRTPNGASEILLNGLTTTNTLFNINDCSKENIISYKLNALEQINNSNYRIERNFNSYNILNYSYSIKVPLEFSLNQNLSIPQKFEIEYNNSNKIFHFKPNEVYVLYFNKFDLETHSMSFQSIFEELDEKIVIYIFLFAFLLGCLLTYIYMKNKLYKLPQKIVPSYVLDKEEKEILTVIKENSGINQKQIGSKLNYSKSKVSAIVNNLEQKELVKREKFGRSFKVYINKKIV